MSKRFIITIITLLVIALSAGVVILLAKGYTISPSEKRIVGTGIITVASQPDSASVFIDGHLTTATNATISSLSPKTYSVRVVKEGFIPWEKSVTVKEGLVTELKLTLFPAIPTIYPLTFTGVLSPVLSPDGGKLAYIISSGKKAGVWVWTMTQDQPIAFARSSEPHQIAVTATTDFSKATLKWSADSKQVLATIDNERSSSSSNNYLLESDRLNSEPRDITPVLEATMNSWNEDIKAKDLPRLQTIKDLKVKQVASDSALIKWSPDETKFMARKEAVSEKDKGVVSGIKVYDLEENERSSSATKEYELPAAKVHIWLPDSKHVILVEENMISLVDFDGTNKAVIYAGNFKEDLVFPWPDYSRLVVVSSLPTPTASEPNLYGINLK